MRKIGKIIFIFSFIISQIAFSDLTDDPDDVVDENSTVKADEKQKEEDVEKTSPKEEKKKTVKIDPPKETKKQIKTKPKDSGNKEPIHLKSDGKSTFSRDGGIVHLAKNVVITQASLRLRADEAKVHLDLKNSENNVKKVEIKGSVKVSKFSDVPSETITAKGDKAFFFNSQRRVILVGNARLWRGGHLIKGNKITYQLDTGMITVDQATGVVQPEKTGKRK